MDSVDLCSSGATERDEVAHSRQCDILDEDFVGESGAIGSVKDIAASIAGRRSTVLILGQTGTGKEMLARHIHQLSDRRDNPFVTVDCSALTETLFESQVFGHVKGAFTGAIRDSLGFIRVADTGTLFLDEIGELPAAMQAKLLRVIQERTVTPVGGTKSYPVDLRLICATNRDLAAMVREGTFREDLYFRINVVTMTLPPLRERQTDILPLAKHFLRQQSSIYNETPKWFSRGAAVALESYAWPGNVRELANVVEHAYVMCERSEIDVLDLPERVRSRQTSLTTRSDLNLRSVERQILTEALRRTQGNKTAAARMVGLNVQKFRRRLVTLKLDD
jgi:transcriptional regulator with PAS, ATPase and Fis domain